LVIPGPWRGGSLAADQEFAAMLAERVSGGDEIIQHGWRHCVGPDRQGWRSVTERALARGAGEFAAISEPAAALRLRAGRAALESVGLVAEGFTAPGWLHSRGTLAALRESGFRFTTTHTGVLDLLAGRHITGPVFSHRAGGTGQALAALVLTTGTRTMVCGSGLVRIALHPDDLSYPALRKATLTAIDRCLASGVRPTTYGALLVRNPAGATE
jgi:uncharacterized protein